MTHLSAFRVVVIWGNSRAFLKMLEFSFAFVPVYFASIKSHFQGQNSGDADILLSTMLRPETRAFFASTGKHYTKKFRRLFKNITMINRSYISFCHLQASRKRTICCWKLWCCESIDCLLQLPFILTVSPFR